MIPSNNIDFYGDQTRWFVGEVVNVKDDPLQIGRARVRVYGVYDNKDTISDEDLPWAQVLAPATQGVHEGNGQYLGLLVGTQVFGIFLDGKNSQLPLVLGTLPKEGDKNPRTDQRGEYPKNKVYKTESGHFKEYDDTKDAERIKEYHSAGTWSEIQSDGSRTTYVQKDETLVVNNNGKVQIVGDGEISINGNCTIKVVGNTSLTVGGTLSLNGSTVKLNS